jgi:hypothetical protein
VVVFAVVSDGDLLRVVEKVEAEPARDVAAIRAAHAETEGVAYQRWLGCATFMGVRAAEHRLGRAMTAYVIVQPDGTASRFLTGPTRRAAAEVGAALTARLSAADPPGEFGLPGFKIGGATKPTHH